MWPPSPIQRVRWLLPAIAANRISWRASYRSGVSPPPRDPTFQTRDVADSTGALPLIDLWRNRAGLPESARDGITGTRYAAAATVPVRPLRDGLRDRAVNWPKNAYCAYLMFSIVISMEISGGRERQIRFDFRIRLPLFE